MPFSWKDLFFAEGMTSTEAKKTAAPKPAWRA
jgi:hypothetical protein